MLWLAAVLHGAENTCISEIHRLLEIATALMHLVQLMPTVRRAQHTEILELAAHDATYCWKFTIRLCSTLSVVAGTSVRYVGYDDDVGECTTVALG